MNIATIEVSGVYASAKAYTHIPAGLVGATVTFDFSDPKWDNLSKTAIFRGNVTRDVIMSDNIVRVPPETVEEPGSRLLIGVYGVDSNENIVIPTLWTDIGPIRPAADPSGDPSVDPSLPVWAQLAEEIEKLKQDTPENPDAPVFIAEYGVTTNAEIFEANETGNACFAKYNNMLLPIASCGDMVTTFSGTNGFQFFIVRCNGNKWDMLKMPFTSTLSESSAHTEFPTAKAVVEYVNQNSGGNVAYDEAQNLTDAQKAQARENIGAQPAGNYLTEVPDGYAKTEDVPTDAKIIQLIKDNAPEPSGGGIAVTGAKVGQTVKISAVDENGAPTAWESVDFPSGEGSGGGEKPLELIADVSVTEDCERVIIRTDINGNEFEISDFVASFIGNLYTSNLTQLSIYLRTSSGYLSDDSAQYNYYGPSVNFDCRTDMAVNADIKILPGGFFLQQYTVQGSKGYSNCMSRIADCDSNQIKQIAFIVSNASSSENRRIVSGTRIRIWGRRV